MLHEPDNAGQDKDNPRGLRSTPSSTSNSSTSLELQEHEDSEPPNSNGCQGDCELNDFGNKGWHVYNLLQRVPAFLNRYVNYPHNKWLTTRDLARKLDQMEQHTHHHSLEQQVSEQQFLLLDARGKKEYRTSHIHGAIQLPISAHLCMFVRPGWSHVQKHFFEPTAHSPLRKSKGKPVFDMLQNLDKSVEIVVYCAVGYRSGWITRALCKQGFNATALYGGLYKWANEGREIYRFKTDRKNPDYNGTKDHFMAKVEKFKEPARLHHHAKESKDGRPEYGRKAKRFTNYMPRRRWKPSKEQSETHASEVKVNNADARAQLDEEVEAETDSQGMHVPDEELANKIEPHQFAAVHMLAPQLKPAHAD